MPQTTQLPDGREILCVNAYEVDFAVIEIFTDDLAAHGIVLPENAQVIDVGANIGLFAIHVRDVCPSARLLAYEPMPETCAALRGNLAALGGAAEAVEMALGRAAGEVEFDHFPGLSALSTGKPQVGARMSAGIRAILGGQGTPDAVRDVVAATGARDRMVEDGFLDDVLRVAKVPVRVDTLSAQMAARGIGAVDLLKVDTEGAEDDVLDGIGTADWPRIAQLVVEVHTGDAACDALCDRLAGLGYGVSVERHPLAEGGARVTQIYARR